MNRLDFYKKYFNEDNKIIFNPIFWHLSKYLNDRSIRYIYIYGGSSAAKTYSIMQALSVESYINKYNCYIMRKYSNAIKDTIYSDFKGFCSALNEQSTSRLGGLFDDLIIIQNEIRSSRNLLRFKGVDDSEKIKGLSGFTKVFLDEITEFEISDLKQVRKRLRGRDGQQIITTWNPVSIHHWIKKNVLDKDIWIDQPTEIDGMPESKLSENAAIWKNKKGNSILIKTTYLDNYWVVGHEKGGFLDKHVISDFEDDKINDENAYNIYALGEWGNPPEGLVFEENINWFKYTELPDIDFYETYGLDFGGGGVNENRKCYPELLKFDEPDGSSTTVLVKLLINKASMSVYVKLLIYKAYIHPVELSNLCKEFTFSQNGQYKTKKNILADNARGDNIRLLINDGLNVIGAKTKQGGSRQVVSGIDIMKKYKIYFHVDDLPCHVDANNYRWEKNMKGELTGNPVKAFENVWDSVRYGLVNFDLYSW